MLRHRRDITLRGVLNMIGRQRVKFSRQRTAAKGRELLRMQFQGKTQRPGGAKHPPHLIGRESQMFAKASTASASPSAAT